MATRAALPQEIKFETYAGCYQRRNARPMWSVLNSDDAKLGKACEGSGKAHLFPPRKCRQLSHGSGSARGRSRATAPETPYAVRDENSLITASDSIARNLYKVGSNVICIKLEYHDRR